ncbi:MAG: PspA/IM30 family protein [Sphingomicrobium sp.]
MVELEVLEAKVPVRTPVLIGEPANTGPALRPAVAANWLSGPVFSRARDIFAANMTDLLDRAEDPSRMIRMIILEMEETLVEVRSCAARSIADVKEMRRALGQLDDLQANWTDKAQLALSKDRDDLARLALLERQKAAEMADSLTAELDQIEAVLKSYEGDIAKLQGKLREARVRQNAIAARFEGALTRARTNEIMHGPRTEDAFAKFTILERRADFAEGRADALGMTGPKSLEQEIAELKVTEEVDCELQAMKAALAARQA